MTVVTPFAVEITGEPEAPVVVVSGEIDVATSPQLRRELAALVARGARDITLQFAEVSFVDSSGLGVLVGTYKRLREDDSGSIRIVGAQPSVRDAGDPNHARAHTLLHAGRLRPSPHGIYSIALPSARCLVDALYARRFPGAVENRWLVLVRPVHTQHQLELPGWSGKPVRLLIRARRFILDIKVGRTVWVGLQVLSRADRISVDRIGDEEELRIILRHGPFTDGNSPFGKRMT